MWLKPGAGPAVVIRETSDSAGARPGNAKQEQ